MNEREIGAESYKGGLLYVSTVYPAESWAPRVRAHEFTADKPNPVALCNPNMTDLLQKEHHILAGIGVG